MGKTWRSLTAFQSLPRAVIFAIVERLTLSGFANRKVLIQELYAGSFGFLASEFSHLNPAFWVKLLHLGP
jgi:hypothetical protein